MSQLRSRLSVIALASALLVTASCGSDDEDDIEPSDVSTPNGSAVPGEPQDPVNTDPSDSQVTPTIAP